MKSKYDPDRSLTRFCRIFGVKNLVATLDCEDSSVEWRRIPLKSLDHEVRSFLASGNSSFPILCAPQKSGDLDRKQLFHPKVKSIIRGKTFELLSVQKVDDRWIFMAVVQKDNDDQVNQTEITLIDLYILLGKPAPRLRKITTALVHRIKNANVSLELRYFRPPFK